MTKNAQNKVQFEIVNSDIEKAVFQRTVKVKGRSSKEIKKIQSNLPTTTLHYFSEEEYNRLKKIEDEILKELESIPTIKERISILDFVLKKVLEI